ncbi:glycosyltransferase [Flavobacterium ajazii]|uniref:glycosyltransferase n=1 Tax=Flavobacterium ajazii TaxID=2692318 RepID=UPI0013D8590E|nr:glycosyltransferase [Flavobacterium ajazii]
MKILLVGEYSRLHNSLKEALITLGHDVVIIATGDNFKKYDVDYSLYPSFFCDFWFIRKIKNLIYLIAKTDLESLEKGIRFYFFLSKLKDYDVVQLINSNAIETYPVFSRFLLKKLFRQNKKTFLLVCGEETPIVEYLLKNEMRYSILSPLFTNQKLKEKYGYTLKYIQKNYQKTFDFIKTKTTAIITSDLDYKIPMEEMGYNIQFIPNPINIDKIVSTPLTISNKIIIFLGINESSSIKKGVLFFEKALEIIQEKYPDKIEVITTKSIPYNQYIKLYNKAHILLDQVYGYDQGYNALEAMSKGKVVFTGAETEFMEHYNLNERVCINALPDVNSIVKELSFLIENPDEIIAIGKRARIFIEQEHNYIKIAERYLNTWKKY